MIVWSSQQTSNLAVLVFSAVYLWTSTRVTLFINVNPRFTFPFRQTKIIPYLFHFTKRDSKGILFYWMIAVSLIGFKFSEKNFLIICKRKTHFIPLNSIKLVKKNTTEYGKLFIIMNVLSNWGLCWRHVLEWLIGKLLYKIKILQV